ncbi:MAG: hypothetical protein ACFFDF_25615 [Candidatus Odinarchaeota archaeon]
MSKINERKELIRDILGTIAIILGIPFLLGYFIMQYLVIITGFVEGFFDLTTTVDFFYIIHTILLSIIVFTLFILFIKKIYKKKYFKVIDLASGKDITDFVEIEIQSKNKELEG